MTIVPHQFANITISQTAEDIILKDGRMIPKGYVNATEMCKANGKRIDNWLRLGTTKALLEETFRTTSDLSKYVDLLTIEGQGDITGTWVSYRVAMNLAQWLSPKFALWAGEALMHVINGDFKALTKEAEQAQRELIKTWEKVRDAGKVTRRRLTDSIKDWYLRNPNGTSRPQGVMYAITTDAIYLKLWGMKAVQLEAHLGCERHESRNTMDTESLRLLDRAEDNVNDYIDEDNIKPIDAVSLANIRKAKNLPVRKN